MSRQLSESELAVLIEGAAPPERLLSLSFGAHGAWLLDTPGNDWARAILGRADELRQHTEDAS